jgi:ankyrin repeat protein
VKHLLFEELGDAYPYALEEKFDRILVIIEKLWGKPEIEDYFTDLIIDRRGDRQGFPKDVLDDILRLREFHHADILRRANARDMALAELKKLGIPLIEAEFLKAVEDGDRRLVDLFIQSAFNIRVTNPDIDSPLLIAIKKGYTIIANMLVKAGVEVNDYDKMGDTPLLLTCGKNTESCISIARNLILRGAYINERNGRGYTPLMLSIAAGTDEITELLIDKRADVRAGTLSGITPLSLAMEARNVRIAQLLVKAGAPLPEDDTLNLGAIGKG